MKVGAGLKHRGRGRGCEASGRQQHRESDKLQTQHQQHVEQQRALGSSGIAHTADSLGDVHGTMSRYPIPRSGANQPWTLKTLPRSNGTAPLYAIPVPVQSPSKFTPSDALHCH